MHRPRNRFFGAKTLIALALILFAIVGTTVLLAEGPTLDDVPELLKREGLDRGKTIFRFDRFGSHLYFSRTLKLFEPIRELGPVDALGVGLKVDVEALPPGVLAALQDGTLDLTDPANTIALILADAVVGVRGKPTPVGGLFEIGITCALCHSTVDDSVAPSIGQRLDGWANRDLDVGAILALAPRLQPVADLLGVDVDTVRAVLQSWGPGKFDAHLNLDAKAFRPDGGSGAVLIPPAFGLAGVNLATYTGWGTVSYWNAFVANVEMNGLGRFVDPRLDDAEQFPIAAAAGFGDKDDGLDLITKKLGYLHEYQLSLAAPAPPEGSYDPVAATRGEALFNGRAACATCHVPPLYTEPGYNLHAPDEIGIDDFQSSRSPTGKYRTTPLRGLWTHTKGGFYHDGRFATLRDVLDHYDTFFAIGLIDAEKDDLEAFLMSL